MIVYSKRWGGLPLVFHLTGTSWPQGIIPALVSVGIGIALSRSWLDEIIMDRDKFMDHPYPFQLYAFIIGFLIVFRTNFAYSRFWEGRGTIAQMGSKWLDAACMSVSFDAPGNKSTPYLEGVDTQASIELTKNGAPSHCEFVIEILHLFSLMHALALQHLRRDGNLDNLKGFSVADDSGDNINLFHKSRLPVLPSEPQHSDRLEHLKWRRTYYRVGSDFDHIYKEQALAIICPMSEAERLALHEDSNGKSIPTEARVTMVEGWIMRRLIARQKHEDCDMGITSPPILSRLYQVISDGHIGFGQAAKITETPFPFPYQNLLQIFLWIYVATVPVLMNAWLRNEALRISLTFISVWCYFALNQVGNNLEDPYIPYDPNEIPLQHIQHSYNAKLLSFCGIPVFEARITGSTARPTTATTATATTSAGSGPASPAMLSLPLPVVGSPLAAADQIPISPSSSSPLLTSSEQYSPMKLPPLGQSQDIPMQAPPNDPIQGLHVDTR